MQKCFTNAPKLFEKFNRDVDRNTQHKEWCQISAPLADDGIVVKDIANLRKNVTNLTRRAMVI